MKKIYRLQYEVREGKWNPTGMFAEEMPRVTTDEMAKRLADIATELNPSFKYRAVYHETYDACDEVKVV